MNSNDNSTRFTAAVLLLEKNLVFSQKKNGVIEFFGGSDKGFPYEDNFIFFIEIKKILQKYGCSSLEISSYLKDVLCLEIQERQMIHLALVSAGILIKKMRMVHYQHPSGIDQFFYLILKARYVLPIGFLVELNSIKELSFIKKLGFLLKHNIENHHYVLSYSKLQHVDKYKIQKTHYTPLEKVFKFLNIQKIPRI